MYNKMDNLTELLQGLEVGFTNQSAIESKLFEVLDRKSEAPNLFLADGTQYEAPKSTDVYRTDTGACLGTVGQIYQSIQPKDFYKAVSEGLTAANLDASNLEYFEHKDGRIISLDLKISQSVFTNRTGLKETSDLSILFKTGFGGSAASAIRVGVNRHICNNACLLINGKKAMFKHTENMNAKMLITTSAIFNAIDIANNVTEYHQNLDKISVTDNDIRRFKNTMLGIKADTVISTKKQNQLDQLSEGMEIEMSRTGKSAYGLLQGTTYYTNHLAKAKVDRDYLHLGTGNTTNELAQKVLATLS
jgi:hypothetical protein|tara:strand:+ start:879 stop:1790 length:912 start_codon:yes stop_codon:yes gene_type:complete